MVVLVDNADALEVGAELYVPTVVYHSECHEKNNCTQCQISKD